MTILLNNDDEQNREPLPQSRARGRSCSPALIIMVIIKQHVTLKAITLIQPIVQLMLRIWHYCIITNIVYIHTYMYIYIYIYDIYVMLGNKYRTNM